MGNICFKVVTQMSPDLTNHMIMHTQLTSVDRRIINNYNNRVPLKHINPRTGRSLSIS